MNEWIYGQWRGKPARENRKTGIRYAFTVTDERTYDGYWSALGFGYCTEFKAWPDQVDSDHWATLHHV